MKKLDEQRGITLIALVITIILLIILAGIGIGTVVGEGSLLKRTEEVAKQTKIEEYREELELLRANPEIEKGLQNLSGKEYMDIYEEEAKKDKKLENATIIRKDQETVRVITKEEYVYDVTEDEVKYIGERDELRLPPDLKESDIDFLISPSDLTNTDVTVELVNRIEGFILEYSLDGENWERYIESINVDKNGPIYARLVNESGEQGGYATGNITNIDKLPPIEFDVLYITTTNSITIEGSTEDASETKENVSSGIKAYYFSKDDGVTWLPINGQEETTYTFNDLNEGTTYKIKMKAIDNVGNETVTDALSVTTKKFDTEYGKIDIVWIDEDNNPIDKPLAPILSEMTPIKYNGTIETITTSSDEEWYDYRAITGTEDNTTSKWANAKNSDGSYFVWIPRYAYRITYYDSETSGEITGYCDGRGIVDPDGNQRYPLDSGIETITKDGLSYIVHPAFMNDVNNSYSHGGWSSDLAGIWVGKYESSHSDATSSDEGSVDQLKVVPNVISWNKRVLSDYYTIAYNYDRNKESHLMKNSEWGAVVYLTHSQYGRNGHRVSANNSASYITGTSGYNTSSTGNIYGIFDLVGGAYEYVAIFNDTDNNNYETNYASSFAGVNKSSTKYATKYSNSTTTGGGEIIYTVGKIGDASKEVAINGTEENWFNVYGLCVNANYPVLMRGGDYKGDQGMFHSRLTSGSDFGVGISFRAVLCF